MLRAMSTIERAPAATKSIEDHSEKALAALTRAYRVNSFGVFSEPPIRRAELREAMSALTA